MIVICDDYEIVAIAADIDGSDLPAGADDKPAADIDGSDLPAGADDKHERSPCLGMVRQLRNISRVRYLC